MAHGTKESDFQNKIFLPHLNSLGWNSKKGADLTDVEKKQWVLRTELLKFLRDGCASNSHEFQKLLSSDFNGNEYAFLEAFISESLLKKWASSPNGAALLRETISFRGCTFHLWNTPALPAASKQEVIAFERNICTVVDECWLTVEPYAGKPYQYRVDSAFFVNGIYLGLAELKFEGTGQSAKQHGTAKIAENLVRVTQTAIENEKAAVERGGVWSGISTLSADSLNRIRLGAAPYLKACYLLAIDSATVLQFSALDTLVQDVGNVIFSKNPQQERALLIDRLIKTFSTAPEILGVAPGWDSVKEHLNCLFSIRHGVHREIDYFNQVQEERHSSTRSILRPRAAQRIMLHRAVQRVIELYRDEATPKVDPVHVEQQLRRKFHNISQQDIDDVLKDSSLFINGQSSHSILLQGAAGLGKTNIIIWLARALTELIDPKTADTSRGRLFDTIILLTDRTELRKNIADEAWRTTNTRGTVTHADTFENLKKALETESRIIVVNIQKFPAIDNLEKENPELVKSLQKRRVAIVIDEVHRSQNGILHDATLEVFDEWSNVGAATGKKNLIVGLTATPSDEALARFGEWNPPEVFGDRAKWTPYFSYTLAQAIKDGVILNPLQAVMTFQDVLQFDYLGTAQKARESLAEAFKKPSSDDIYTNPNRQEFIAKRAAEIFASNTIRAIEYDAISGAVQKERSTSGKAIFACHSIRAAILMHERLKQEIRALADDSRFADRRQALLEAPILILYSDRQGETKCADLNMGKSEEKIIKAFREAGSPEQGESKVKNALIVVVDKLLTGFDEPTMHTIFIDRALDDVGLFQAVCRINRTSKGKKGCLVVDFSHDGVVSKNLPAVFNKYGGLTLSKDESLPLQERMEASFKQFYNHRTLGEHWKVWTSTYQGGKDHAGAMQLSDWLNELVDKQPDEAQIIRKWATTYLGAFERLHAILDFSKEPLNKYSDHKRRTFAKQVAQQLRTKDLAQEQPTQIIFDIEDVGEAETWTQAVHGQMGAENSAPNSVAKKQMETIGVAVSSIVESEDLLQIMAALELEEDKKREAIDTMRTFTELFFEVIRNESPKLNEDIYGKMLGDLYSQGGKYSTLDREEKFAKLFNAARSTLGKPAAKTGGISPQAIRKMIDALSIRVPLLMSDYERWFERNHFLKKTET